MAVPKKLQVLGTIKGEPGRDGATFKPAIDEEGNLSWTNDQGLENPTTINLKGPKGEPGESADGTVIASVNDDVLIIDTISDIASINIDETLSYGDNSVLRVNVTEEIKVDCDLPVTSSGVHAALIDTQSVNKLVTSIDENSDDIHYPSAKAVKTLVDSIDTVGEVKSAVDSYLTENPPQLQFTINGISADDNGNFNIEASSNVTDNVVDF